MNLIRCIPSEGSLAIFSKPLLGAQIQKEINLSLIPGGSSLLHACGEGKVLLQEEIGRSRKKWNAMLVERTGVSVISGSRVQGIRALARLLPWRRNVPSIARGVRGTEKQPFLKVCLGKAGGEFRTLGPGSPMATAGIDRSAAQPGKFRQGGGFPAGAGGTEGLNVGPGAALGSKIDRSTAIAGESRGTGKK